MEETLFKTVINSIGMYQRLVPPCFQEQNNIKRSIKSEIMLKYCFHTVFCKGMAFTLKIIPCKLNFKLGLISVVKRCI